MNYQQLLKDLQAEVKNAVRYKRMSTPYRVLTLIGLAPILLVKWMLIIYFYAFLFLYNALLAPVSYLEAWQDDRTKNVKHATEAVVFWVSTPFIFFLRVLMSIASFFFYFLWFDLMCANYLLTLGSIRWQPFLNTATFDSEKEYRWDLTPGETGTMVFGIIAFSLFCVLTLLFNIFVFGEVVELYEVTMIFMVIYYVVILFVNPVLFRKRELAEGESEYVAPKRQNSFVNASQTYGQTYNQPYGQTYNQRPYGQTYNQQTYTQQPYGQPYNPAQQPQQSAPEAPHDNNQ